MQGNKVKLTHFFYNLWKSYLDCILSILICIFALTSEWKFISMLNNPILLRLSFNII